MDHHKRMESTSSSSKKSNKTYKAYFEPQSSSDEEASIPRTTLYRYKGPKKKRCLSTELGLHQHDDTSEDDFDEVLPPCNGADNVLDDLHVPVYECSGYSSPENYNDEDGLPSNEEHDIVDSPNSEAQRTESDNDIEDQPSSDDPSSPPLSSSDSSSDEDQPAFGVDESLNEPIFQGSHVTKAEVFLMIMAYVMRHCLSTVALVDLLHIVNEILGRTVLPASKFLFKKLFSGKFMNLSFHFYCVFCFSFVRTWSGECRTIACPHCNRDCNVGNLNASNFFVTSDLKQQIKTLFEKEEIQNNLSYKHNRTKIQDDNLEDIFDGQIYQNLEDSLENNFTYTFNADGMPVFKSANYSLWPIYIMINELPPNLRMKNLLLAGVWFGKTEPRMNIFLEKFVAEANILAEDGVDWEHGGEHINSKFFGICCCVDSPARAAMQNRLQFNGYMGCGLCYHPGRAVERVVKYPIDVCNHGERCDDDMLEDMARAMNEGRTIRGVKGPTPVINMPRFPLVWGFPPDFMHCLLLGVARQLAELWFSGPANNNYYIGRPVSLVRLDKILTSIKVPSFVARMPRPITERKHWKATEWYNWLFYFSIPCLQGVLPVQYLNHLCILVQGCYLLLQKSISPQDINTADLLLFNFVGKMQLLYGERAMTSNIHSLLHLTKSVKMWGPLWTHSCFPFETANGQIKSLLKGNRGIMLQAMYKFFLMRAQPLYGIHYRISQRTKYFCKALLSPRKLQPTELLGSIQLFGAGSLQHLSDIEHTCLLGSGYEVGDEVLVYNRVGKEGLIFHSSEYTKATRRNSMMFYLTTGQVGKLHKVISIGDECILLYKEIGFVEGHVFQDLQNDTHISHIKMVSHISENLSAAPATELSGCCIFLEIGERTFICFPANYVALF